MPVPFWAGHYIGLPFKDHGRDRDGLDCWGLVRLVLAEQFSLALPSYTREYERTTQVANISKLIERELALIWSPVEKTEAQLGDIIILRMRGKPMHVGLVLDDEHMLHIEPGINSAIERYTSPRWSERIFGFYRYRPAYEEHDLATQTPFYF
jgi:cell wall-associated NlpC family hydrolase